jgi:hypothetical protein
LIGTRFFAYLRGPLPLGLPAFALLAALSAGCSGTGNGGTGDPPSEPLADPCGGGQRLPDVVGEATWVSENDTACANPSDKAVQISGVRIIAIDRFDETGDGSTGNYYVSEACADPIGAYSGMTVYAPSFSPPDLRLAPGDVVDLLGNFTEFRGPSGSPFPDCRTLPEIGGTMSFRMELGPELEPHTIPITDLKSYEGARPWLGMLVRIEDVTLADNPKESNGRYTVPLYVGGGISQADVPFISNELFDLKNEGPVLADGGTFSSVVGVVTYFYGFKIAPRSSADFTP